MNDDKLRDGDFVIARGIFEPMAYFRTSKGRHLAQGFASRHWYQFDSTDELEPTTIPMPAYWATDGERR